MVNKEKHNELVAALNKAETDAVNLITESSPFKHFVVTGWVDPFGIANIKTAFFSELLDSEKWAGIESGIRAGIGCKPYCVVRDGDCECFVDEEDL